MVVEPVFSRIQPSCNTTSTFILLDYRHKGRQDHPLIIWNPGERKYKHVNEFIT